MSEFDPDVLNPDRHAHRGVVRNWAKVARPVSFEGLRWGPITPTDIDMFTCYVHKPRSQGSIFVYGELKEEGVALPIGQAWGAEEQVRAIAMPHRALAFMAWHPPDVDVIVAATAIVQRTYYRAANGYTTGRRWSEEHRGVTVKQLVDDWLEDCGWTADEAYEPAG